ncbi:formate dehydrogenase [Micractinium conductrix]|uniref:Formate dehydrogenase n=1 Tax=Micractinium conductrix TaxID=554055 RepID=A0A2P6VAL8_9CHLO|nr:formate dehydrogenase [Micractinium conductrix]|eukprot:PSC71091.1 formate dehydrogenase [Micractinium conductrix]
MLAAAVRAPAIAAAAGSGSRPAPRSLQSAQRTCHNLRAAPLRAQSEKEAARHGRRAGDEAEGAVPATADSDFAALAKQAAGLLASEFSSNEDTLYNKLQSWLEGSHDEEGQVEPRSDQAAEEGGAKAVLRAAAERYGVPTTLAGAVGSVKSWLSSPPPGEAGQDSRLVGRLVHRLLEEYEKSEGQGFEGRRKRDWDRLYTLASAVLGPSLTKRMLLRLVRSYLGV